MYLKALEMQGFKSFPDKTVLSFEDADITAIVGPNGSGKSNISDAIRWVMGEQSTKALRGGKMEDVIFGGTEARRGQGFAQVSLTLDNADGRLPMEENEIVVTRRYYRSGESEYYINRHLVRLKDINELFMDTGLGQEGYSLIGQGKIDEILAVKSTQRREIFEEAAGISRYRHRKEEAERKLERTRENLLRIGDKIEELELQVEPLREQAEKARRYFSCQEELRLLEISLWMARLEGLRVRHQELREAHTAMARQLEEVKGEAERLYAASEALSHAAQCKEEELEKARAHAAQLEEAGASCEARIGVLEVQVKNNRENTLRLQEEREAQMSRGRGLAAQVEARDRDLQAMEAQEQNLKAALEARNQEIQEQERALAGLNLSLERLDQQAAQETSSTQRILTLISALDASAHEVADREEGLERSLAGLQAQLEEAAAQEREQGEVLSALKLRQEEQGRVLAEARERAAKNQSAAARAEEGWVALRMEENALSARMRMLEEMEKLYEGYSKSVKTVLEQAERGALSGVHGPVAGLIQVPGRYIVAIEIALGGAMQNLVVESRGAGKAVLEFLKRKDAGRVTCLPMDAMQPSFLNKGGFSEAEGYLGIAAELISFDPRYRAVMENLLGKVVLVDTLEHGIAMARQFKSRFRIVTLDGQVLAPGGAMTGGSVNKKGGILTRATELEKLHGQQEALLARRAEAQLLLDGAKAEAIAAQETAQAAEAARQELESRRLTLRGQLDSRMAQREALRRQEAQVLEELAQLREKNSRQQDQAKLAQEKIRQMETAGESLAARREQLESQRQALLRQGEALARARQELLTKSAVLETERRVSQQSCQELEALRETIFSDYERQGSEIARIERETEALLSQQKQERRAAAVLLEQKVAQQEALKHLTQEKLELEAKRNQAERDGRGQNETLLYCQRETAVLEQKSAAAQQEEAQLLDKLWDSYETTHEGALSIRVPIEDRGRAQARVAALREEIRGLGNVNLGAVEEYQRVSERYEYLQAQRRDVEEAAGELVEVIEGLTKEMRAIFAREFVRISQAFGETFAKLFQGGKASLALEDEEDILSCGIEIRVQPPGKSLKHLNLLSGGEKAFVAIALYFAILQVRPTPFCVLDEIEAALDDVNVVRFAQYLRSISGKTQFIIITHRRGTMEEADVLFGVTMEQQGVSRMLRLNLNEAEAALKAAVK